MESKLKVANWLIHDTRRKRKANDESTTFNIPKDGSNKCVVKTAQARAKLQKIVNNIGPYECKLCKHVYEDAFELAMHNCPRVVHLEYKCDVCEKVFNCPANLASHKRWHRLKSKTESNSSLESSLNVTDFWKIYYNSYVISLATQALQSKR